MDYIELYHFKLFEAFVTLLAPVGEEGQCKLAIELEFLVGRKRLHQFWESRVTVALKLLCQRVVVFCQLVLSERSEVINEKVFASPKLGFVLQLLRWNVLPTLADLLLVRLFGAGCTSLVILTRTRRS